MKQLPRSQKLKPLKGKKCKDCDLYLKARANCVAGTGIKNTIMVIGEFPRKGDISSEKPFVGEDGTKLKYLFESAGLNREAMYLTHAVKCDLGKSKKANKKTVAACKFHLAEEIAWVRPKVIVTMGTTPLKMIMPNAQGADDMRGFPYPLYSKKGQHIAWVVPTLSIGQAVNDPTSDPILLKDLALARRLLRGEIPKPLDIKVHVLNTVDAWKKIAREMYQSDSWSFDLETRGFDFLTRRGILCASFSMDGKTGYTLPIDHKFKRSGKLVKWTETERTEILDILVKLFKCKASKTAQNGKFDLKWLRAYKVLVRNFDFDTMLAHHLVDSEKPHDLIFISQWYDVISEKYDFVLEVEKEKLCKELGIKNDEFTYDLLTPDNLYWYAGIDAAITQALKPILQAEMIKLKLFDVFKKISMPLSYLLADMEFRGARINLQEMNEIIRRVDTQIGQLTAELKLELKVDEFKPNGTKDLAAYFKKKRIFSTGKKTPGGAPSYDEEVLNKLASNSRVGAVCTKVLQLRGLSKLKTTYLDGNGKDKTKGMRNKLDANHYLHTNFKIHGTYTGRLSSVGPNLQNIPKAHGIRQLFLPDGPNDIFMDVDYKQLEVRIAAAISKDPILIQEVLDGVDMHSRNAAIFLLNMKEEDFVAVINDKNHPNYHLYKEKRRAAKAVTFGTLYGSTPEGVSARENIPVEDCKTFIRGFFKKYRVLNEFIQSQHDKVMTFHKVVSPTNRTVTFSDLNWTKSGYCSDRVAYRRYGEVKRISVNMPIQGYGSDIFQMKCLELYAYLKTNKMKSRFVLSIHDGFVLNVVPEEVQILKEVVPELMKTTLNAGTRYAIPLEVDFGFTRKWEGESVTV